LVLGVKGTLSDPTDGATELRELLEAHRFSWGCGFVPQGTPTNNTETAVAGYSREDVGFERSYALEREERPLPSQRGDNAADAALAFGLNVSDLAPLCYADGHDQRDAADINRVFWPATLGYFLNQILNGVMPGANLDAWREYFVSQVRACGPLP